MRKMIFGIAVLALLCAPAFAGSAPECIKCTLYKTAPPSNPWPFRGPRICIYFTQAQVDAVDLLLYREDGTPIKLPEHDSHKIAQVQDSFCIGAHWLADAAKIELCNGHATARIYGYLLPQIRQTHVYHACLLGSACKNGS